MSGVTGRQVLLVAVLAAIAVGALTGAFAHVARLGSDEAIPLDLAMKDRTIAALCWVLVGTLVVRAARWWPVGRQTWTHALPAHAAGAVLAGLAVNVLLHSTLWLFGDGPARAAELAAVVGRDTLEHVHLNALVYAAILASVHWIDRPIASAAAAPASLAPRPAPAAHYASRLTARRRDRLTIVAVQDVDWIEGADDYACLHVGTRQLLTDDRLRTLERVLDPSRFVRVHRSAIVNLARVRDVVDGRSGDAIVVLADGTRVRVSRTKRDALMRAIRSPLAG